MSDSRRTTKHTYNAWRLYHAASDLFALDFLHPADYRDAIAQIRSYSGSISDTAMALEVAIIAHWQACMEDKE